MQFIFWITLSALFYTYFGYGLLLFLHNALLKKKAVVDETSLPHLTFIVPAYNEAAVIQQKIDNSLALDYPEEKISLLFVTDGSNDGTQEIIGRHPRIRLLHQQERRGKSAAVSRAMLQVQTPMVVFSDANAMVHRQSLRKLVRHYADESVGGVSGEKRIADGESSVGFGERLYWRYESLLKKANGDFYTIVGAAGELFSMRTKLFQPLPEDTVLDDFAVSATVCLRGFRFLYEAEAYATEVSSASFAEERKRKVRISAGCYQALGRMPGLLNFFRRGRPAFQYLSHRVLRWTVCPLALPLLFIANCFLKTENGFYAVCFWAQGGFYLFALAGFVNAVRRALPKAFLIPQYFLFMVAAQYAGFFRFVRRRQPAAWDKAERGKRP